MSDIDLNAAHMALCVFNKFLEVNNGITIGEKEADSLLISTFNQYAKHIEKRNIHVNAACPYKMLSWISFLLAENIKTMKLKQKAF